MKHPHFMFTCILLCFGYTGIALAQPFALQKETSLPREGDVVSKQELQYKDPGRNGENVVWDFSKLSPLGTVFEEHILGKIDSSLICLSREGGYKFKLADHSLYCIGYQTPTLKIDYLLPDLYGTYPVNYADSVTSWLYGEGYYSQKYPMVIFGKATRKVDAKGIILLPDDVKLDNVLRIKESMDLGQRFSSSKVNFSKGDSTRYSTDSLAYHLQNDKNLWHVETYRWYAPGYRYPVFETVQTSIYSDGKSEKHFNRSYYLSPEEQSYLEEDSENTAILAQIALSQESAHGDRNNNPSEDRPGKQETYAYNYSVGADGSLQIEYYLYQPSTVEIYLYSVAGYVYQHEPACERTSGMYSASFGLSDLPHGNYLLSVIIDGENNMEKIVKQ